MGVDTYPCTDCGECFYSIWAYCKKCGNNYLDDTGNICLDCIKDDYYDKNRVYFCERIHNSQNKDLFKETEFYICDDCINELRDETKLENWIEETDFDVEKTEVQHQIMTLINDYHNDDEIKYRLIDKIDNLNDEIQKKIREMEDLIKKVDEIKYKN